MYITHQEAAWPGTSISGKTWMPLLLAYLCNAPPLIQKRFICYTLTDRYVRYAYNVCVCMSHSTILFQKHNPEPLNLTTYNKKTRFIACFMNHDYVSNFVGKRKSMQ